MSLYDSSIQEVDNKYNLISILPLAGIAVGLYLGNKENANYGKIFLFGCVGAWIGYLPKKYVSKNLVIMEKEHSKINLLEEDKASQIKETLSKGKFYSTSLSQEEANEIAKKIVELENKKPSSNSEFKDIQTQMGEFIKQLSYSNYSYRSGEAIKNK